ncbi:MAG: ATP-binding protein [Rubrivivax sp.]|nr:ATP-binding protein [Rubrivivax sp.]
MNPGADAVTPAAPRGLQRWLPRTLFGRLLLVLASGLLVAQLLSAAINVAERDRLLSSSFGMQPAQRIADVVRLLDDLGEAERQRVVAVFRVPPLVLSLHPAPLTAADAASAWHTQMFASRLRAALGDDRPVRVEAREGYAAAAPIAGSPGLRQGPMRGGGGGGGGGGMMMGHGPGAGAAIVRTEVQLRDGRWARFDTELPAAPQALPWRLALTLAVLLASVLALSYVAVRWVVRPLQQLTQAAQALGQDLKRPPLPEDGPREVQQAARAFNTMQQRLAAFIDERTRMLTALSHDLKTPLTRMRLRADLLDDEEQRLRFESDLKEMEAMVTQTLEFMRGLGGNEPRQPVDMMALLAALQADNQAMGRSVVVEGRTTRPCVGVASLLKRALGNLVDNAMLYGGRTTVRVEETPAALVLCVQDDGPGIPETELERVFEPFYRLEASRSRATGGTGLGLGIARNIARMHGGDLVLGNRPEGGLEARMTLPWHAS